MSHWHASIDVDLDDAVVARFTNDAPFSNATVDGALGVLAEIFASAGIPAKIHNVIETDEWGIPTVPFNQRSGNARTGP